MHEQEVERLREVAAEFMAREANRNSLITVTRAEMGTNGRSATIFITVYPETAEAQAVEFANRNRGEFGKFFETRVRGMRVPRVEFAIDMGDKNRRRLDELTN